MSNKQADHKPSYRMGSVVKTALQALAALTACIVTVIYMSNSLSTETAMSVSVNGEQVGYVRSQDDIAGVKTEVLCSIEAATEGKYTADFDITYDIAAVSNPEYLTEDAYRDYLWSLVEDDFTEAYMLYVDGHQALACENRTELEALMSDIESELLVSGNALFENVRITSDWHIEKQLCLKTAVKPIEEINELINPLENIGANDELSLARDSTLSISALSAMAPAADNDDITVAAPDNGSDLILDYSFVNTVTVNEVICFETEYVDDPTNYIGFEQLVNDGINGEKSVTYELIYDADGRMLERKAVAETVIVPAVNKVISAGSMEIPEAVPTGTFIWPCEQPFGVSSYYGWRDLYGKPDFHLGIDIPDDKGSYIWAADGGTVVFAGRTPSYGNNVHVVHSNGYSTLYAHLDEILVSEGDVLYKKQIVGTMGDTGVAYGVHLHFEVRINNATVNPIKYLPKN